MDDLSPEEEDVLFSQAGIERTTIARAYSQQRFAYDLQLRIPLPIAEEMDLRAILNDRGAFVKPVESMVSFIMRWSSRVYFQDQEAIIDSAFRLVLSAGLTNTQQMAALWERGYFKPFGRISRSCLALMARYGADWSEMTSFELVNRPVIIHSNPYVTNQWIRRKPFSVYNVYMAYINMCYIGQRLPRYCFNEIEAFSKPLRGQGPLDAMTRALVRQYIDREVERGTTGIYEDILGQDTAWYYPAWDLANLKNPFLDT